MIVLAIIGTMAVGILIGYLLRNKDCGFISKVSTLSVWVLLFLLGIEVGGDDKILHGLHTIGLEAFIITIGGTMGSILLAWLLWVIIKKRQK